MNLVLLLALSAVAAGQQVHVSPWFTESLAPERGAGSRGLKQQQAATGGHCGPLTKELVLGVAKENTVLVTVIDKIVWAQLGPSYVDNIRAANISYWLIAALDPETSLGLGAMGATGHCFNAPADRLVYKGTDAQYKWGSNHWTQTTWNKVHVMKAVYEFGVHIIHSDTDVVWFSDPLPYFTARLRTSPVHVVIATDAVQTQNVRGDTGLEISTNPHTNINTGIYFMRQWAGGLAFFDVWLSFQPKNVGHDQDGFNTLARGQFFRGDQGMPQAVLGPDPSERLYYAAYSKTTAISFLPASMFANAYTYVNARLWEKLDHPLYVVHWVWGGSTMESKRQNMRDAIKFHDPPEYYSSPSLVTFDLEQLPMPGGFNRWELQRTEEMIRFHVTAANHQLQQAYYAFAIALITNRTLVLPRFQCYCSKNWYQTQSCRINHETATTFPFTCALSHVLRAKKLNTGQFAMPPGAGEYAGHKVLVREYSFLDNPKVPDDIKRSFVEVVPSALPRPGGLRLDQLVLSTQPAPRGHGRRVTVAAPLSDWELRAVLANISAATPGGARVLHFPQPARTFSGFSKHATWDVFDELMQRHTTHWCCRSPPDMKAFNLTERLQLVALPPERYKSLAPLEARTSYLHTSRPWQGGRNGVD
ncbi:hypothetical protein HYH02_015064 [Chlamydomonas schloesseri]|uniref:Glycosyltransferase n=1 Tax=Chlamydomonas schloesseri TaxID=2026947 RepID=A0A835SR75_9CHLO|nr:hypothetical protein HYH02_015064 [Chlamydomonas schloesseri]|eukprot:KAG2425120.1 hypothetical protein HYH02_015064 [Chlamydomonas schloesseri]